jgi:hypothetical protein
MINYPTNTKTNYLFQKKDSGIKYSHTENYYNDFSTEILLPYKQSTLGTVYQ